MTVWKSIIDAPHNGKTVLVAASGIFPPSFVDVFRANNVRIPTYVHLAKWSTYDKCWRAVPGGEHLTRPTYLEPHLFC